MINFEQAKRYCGEDISLIENYEQASKDLIQTWDIHHHKEEEGYSKQELIDLGMYYGRPASELIFLTKFEHRSLHSKGIPKSEEHRKKISEANKGIPKSEKTKKKISEAQKGKTGEKCHNSKQVLQIDKKTDHIIKTWPCAAEVERILGIYHSSISQCCSGKRKFAGGYIWQYADSTSQKNCRKN